MILKEPDLGTCLLVLIVAVSVILVNGVKLRDLAIAGIGLVLVLPVAWRFMKDYQKRRIFSFLDPESDPLGSAYHLIQSKIAVGSGQFMGKGFMAGTQTQLHFLPEQHTDFAFSVLAEEWGFIGAMVVLLLLAGLIYRGLSTAYRAKDRQGLLIVVGATAMIFWPAIINVGMVLGLFPVVGIPLPFISYGGSSLITTMAALGLIQGVAMRRFVFHSRGIGRPASPRRRDAALRGRARFLGVDWQPRLRLSLARRLACRPHGRAGDFVWLRWMRWLLLNTANVGAGFIPARWRSGPKGGGDKPHPYTRSKKNHASAKSGDLFFAASRRPAKPAGLACFTHSARHAKLHYRRLFY